MEVEVTSIHSLCSNLPEGDMTALCWLEATLRMKESGVPQMMFLLTEDSEANGTEEPREPSDTALAPYTWT